LYTLSYSDNLGANYTNQVVFNVANYPSLPAAYALPSGAGVRRGFTFRSVAARQDTPNLDGNVARAKAQLNGTLIDPDTSMPYTNAATLGTNADGSFTVDMVLNFNDGAVGAGNFPADEQFPGLDSGVPYNWFSSEGVLYLDLPAGYYRFGVNSDDGFAMEVKPPAGISGSPLVVGAFDGDRAPGDTLFDVLVQTPGVYCFNLIYFESTGGAEVEFYSVDLATGEKVLVNDAANPNAIKSYSVLRPRITSIVRNGSNVTIDWAYGTPPFQLQFKNDLAAQWSNIGGTTTNRTASVPIQPGAGFIRLYGQ
jgi:hypothetical protein